MFAVTNWWEHLFSGKSPDEAGALEEEQGMKLARAAASQLSTVEHYIWSTTPSAKRKFNGEHVTPHMDYKANIDARIKSELPQLAARTTYLYFGYYPQNMAYFPLLRPFQVVGDPDSWHFMPITDLIHRLAGFGGICSSHAIEPGRQDSSFRGHDSQPRYLGPSSHRYRAQELW